MKRWMLLMTMNQVVVPRENESFYAVVDGEEEKEMVSLEEIVKKDRRGEVQAIVHRSNGEIYGYYKGRHIAGFAAFESDEVFTPVYNANSVVN
jgi:hypothetical protein